MVAMRTGDDASGTVGGMSAGDVEWFLGLVDELGIDVWLDGGWGVDALLGEQTRFHADLDVIVEECDVAELRRGLAPFGFAAIPTDDRTEWNFVLADPNGRRIDVHVIVIDEHGNGLYGPPEQGVSYPASALTGSGTVGNRPVRCLTADYQVQSHTGYELNENDLHDVMALHDRFGVPLAEEHRRALDRDRPA